MTSDLSITTCHHSKSIGARIEYNHDGQITKQAAAARVPGTTVILQNLFSTLPVRHKEFLRNLKREYAKLVQVLQSYCVISTGVRFSCYTQSEKGKKNLVLSTNGNAEMKENISNVFGPKQVVYSFNLDTVVSYICTILYCQQWFYHVQPLSRFLYQALSHCVSTLCVKKE